MYVIIDCGGFKQIVSDDKPALIKQIQDDFRGASIEGDESGRPNLYTGAEIAGLFNYKGDKVDNREVVINTNVKPFNRRFVG